MSMQSVGLSVDHYWFESRDEFLDFSSRSRKPLLLKNIELGPCTSKWTVEYLSSIFEGVEVKVHVTPNGEMSFLQKNFMYKTMKFNDFLTRASELHHRDWFGSDREKYYLRSIGLDKRGKVIADLKRDFPQISNDIKFPDLFHPKDYFSSVFRIGSEGIRVWTHYDVMDNVLMQIIGSKRVVLFGPSDCPYMYLKGDKSQVLDIDNPDLELYPKFSKAKRYECTLNPGDVLFIPALWFHNTLSLSFGIGVNIFWKHLNHEVYDKTDVYGNKDIMPAAKALELVKKAKKLLETLPPDHKEFYLHRAIVSLKSIE